MRFHLEAMCTVVPFLSECKTLFLSCRLRYCGSRSSWIDTPQGQKVQFKLWKETGEILTKVAPETEYLWDI
jgi:hypothetical protein